MVRKEKEHDRGIAGATDGDSGGKRQVKGLETCEQQESEPDIGGGQTNLRRAVWVEAIAARHARSHKRWRP